MSTPISGKTIIARNSEVISSTIGKETMMMHLAENKYFGLDPIASRVWDLIVDTMSIDQLCEILMAEYEVTKEQCQTDLLELVESLLMDKIIQLVS